MVEHKNEVKVKIEVKVSLYVLWVCVSGVEV
jgi:hypothetical protein